jgi:DNA-binding NtrC family response regulator
MSKPLILCVDDEAIILNSLKIQLKKEFNDNCFYELAESADEAMEILSEMQVDKSDIVVIISDWLMPGVKGDEFLLWVHQNYPNIIKIMLTGQADQSAIERAKEQTSLYACLHKPWNNEELIEIIRSGLEKL